MKKGTNSNAAGASNGMTISHMNSGGSGLSGPAGSTAASRGGIASMNNTQTKKGNTPVLNK